MLLTDCTHIQIIYIDTFMTAAVKPLTPVMETRYRDTWYIRTCMLEACQAAGLSETLNVQMFTRIERRAS